MAERLNSGRFDPCGGLRVPYQCVDCAEPATAYFDGRPVCPECYGRLFARAVVEAATRSIESTVRQGS